MSNPNTKYNGWTNYETWLCNLWFENFDFSDRLDMFDECDDKDDVEFLSLISMFERRELLIHGDVRQKHGKKETQTGKGQIRQSKFSHKWDLKIECIINLQNYQEANNKE